jgi:hypothetical protein
VARRGDLLLRGARDHRAHHHRRAPRILRDDPRAVEDEAQRGSRSLEADPLLSRREIELAQFAGKITQSSADVRGEDFERMFRVGYTPSALREVADVALVFRVIHRLTATVHAHAASISSGSSRPRAGAALPAPGLAAVRACGACGRLRSGHARLNPRSQRFCRTERYARLSRGMPID